MNKADKGYLCDNVKCKNCYYSLILPGGHALCEYIIRTGERRECDVEDCTCFKKKKEKKDDYKRFFE